MTYVDSIAGEIAAGRPVAVAKLVSMPKGSLAAPGQSVVLGLNRQQLSCDIPDEGLVGRIISIAAEMLEMGRSGVQRLDLPSGTVRVYVESHLPDPVLLVVGAGHVGQMVATMGALAGFEVQVLDDRSQFANRERFPTAHQIICGPFIPRLQTLGLSARHYVVLMTRGHHQDRECLEHLVGTPVAYLGMIGSRTRVETVFTLLTESGVDPDLLDRIRAPIGLDIGARTPAEIAISVMAEIIAARRGGTGSPLSALGRSLIHATRR